MEGVKRRSRCQICDSSERPEDLIACRCGLYYGVCMECYEYEVSAHHKHGRCKSSVQKELHDEICDVWPASGFYRDGFLL